MTIKNSSKHIEAMLYISFSTIEYLVRLYIAKSYNMRRGPIFQSNAAATTKLVRH